LPTDWKAPYRAAIKEHDPKKKRSLCDLACRAINDRILDQGPYAADTREIGALEEGLRQLVLHRQDRTVVTPTSDASDSRVISSAVDVRHPVTKIKESPTRLDAAKKAAEKKEGRFRRGT
jgi:hypothetical protein